MKQRFIQSFSTSGTEREAIDAERLGKPYIAYIEDGQYIDWNTLSPPDPYLSVPLTFEIITGGTIGFTSPIGVTIEYSADNGQTWGVFSSMEVEAGDRIMFRGTGRTATADDNNNSSNFTSTNGAKFNIVGNINSLLDKTNYAGITNLSSYGSYTFLRLFAGLNGLVSAENLVLPATTLASFCYARMFSSCSNLIKLPKLPATTLASYCYFVMFSSCPSLATAPELPATTMVTYCYNSMFQNCTSLTTAPELPATILAERCYYNMFNGCTSLRTAPALPATTLANSCYSNMFAGCTGLTTAPALPATILASYCYRDMFYGCTSLTTAPELPATILAERCYYNMFYGCTSLNYIKCLATDISATECTYNWVRQVASTGTFVKDASMIGWTTGNDGIPTGWTVVDAED